METLQVFLHPVEDVSEAIWPTAVTPGQTLPAAVTVVTCFRS
jgi:hypothetical protein